MSAIKNRALPLIAIIAIINSTNSFAMEDNPKGTNPESSWRSLLSPKQGLYTWGSALSGFIPYVAYINRQNIMPYISQNYPAGHATAALLAPLITQSLLNKWWQGNSESPEAFAQSRKLASAARAIAAMLSAWGYIPSDSLVNKILLSLIAGGLYGPALDKALDFLEPLNENKPE